MCIVVGLILAAGLSVQADPLSVAQLLPGDTVAVLSIPDWDKAAACWADSPQGRLWRDPALRPFREKFAERYTEQVGEPLDRLSGGVALSDFARLVGGQVAFAVVRDGWGTRPGAGPACLLVADVEENEDKLRIRLAELRMKWIRAGMTLRVERIRGEEFATFVASREEIQGALSKAFQRRNPAPTAPGHPGAGEWEISVGQVGSWLIVGTSIPAIEKVLARMAGGLAPSLGEQAAFQEAEALSRDALAFAWVHIEPFLGMLQKRLAGPDSRDGDGIPFKGRQDGLLTVTGLDGLETVAARLAGCSEGLEAELFLGVPAARRKGLFQLLAPQRKDASPPAFVGEKLSRFSRWRVDGQKAWRALEEMIGAIAPELFGILQMGSDMDGEDRVRSFDLKESLIENLGGDFIVLEKSPGSSAPADLDGPAKLFLVGSANAAEMLEAIREAASRLPLIGGSHALDEREFLGRKIYVLTVPSMPVFGAVGQSAAPNSVSFTAAGGYVVVSSDAAFVEEYLRRLEAPSRPLGDFPGLMEAAQRVGGMETGYFAWENQAESARVWFETVKRTGAELTGLLSLGPLSESAPSPEERKKLAEWFDVSTLPPFERVSKYFHFVVYSLTASDEGLRWKAFAPVPPRMNAAP